MTKAWITGAQGLIGSHLLSAASARETRWDIRALTRAELDLTDHDAVTREFRSDSPQLVIHCAAMSKSPACQQNPDAAWKTNCDATRHLAGLSADIPFFFFSSDLAFDGGKGNYSEHDSTGPLSVYAETKVAAEKCVLQNPKHTVVRTSLNAGSSPRGDRAFNEEMREAWLAGHTLKMFTDEFRSPIPVSITARAVWDLIDQQATGLFHLAGSERLSRYEIAILIASRHGDLRPSIEATSRQEYRGAPRPADTSLDCRKIQNVLSFRLPGFSEWIRSGQPL